MPELPDVEAVADLLRRRLVGRRIDRVRVLDHAVVRSPSAAAFARRLRGRTVRHVSRRGKYLMLSMDGNLTVVGHLRMTGDFVVVPKRAPIHPHTRLVLGFDAADVRFIDQRRFGHLDLVATDRAAELEGMRALGTEPLGPDFTEERLHALLRTRRGAVKALLLRQDLVAGIGNIYADEILFQARLSPDRTGASLRPAELRRLHRAIVTSLRRGIAALSGRGRTIGDLVEVRKRGGTCPRCRRALRTATIGGRTTYYCRHCQR